jgi:hypothetical protein
MNPSRRQFFQMILAAGLWTAAGKAFAGHAQQALDSKTTAMLTGMFRNIESARTVGNEYLRANPNDADRVLLEGVLSVSSARHRHCVDQPELRAAVVSRVRSDYEFGRVVNVDGWILSQTEARLCALVTLSYP